jgi:phage tail sheath protein FI
MPVQVTYPGVYVEEIPSGGQTITGVATSITAFMGTALCGPLGTSVGGPVTIFSFADYERIFGGLWVNSPMSYAVRDFFTNGGSQAIIVRLYESSLAGPPESAGCALISVAAPSLPPASPPAAGSGSPPSSPWVLYAASPGTWGNNVRVMFATNPANVATEAAQLYANYGVPQDGSDMFNITIFYDPPGGSMRTERFVNLTLTDYPGFPPNPNRVDRILNQQSQLVQVFPDDVLTSEPTWLASWLSGWNAFSTSSNLANYNQAQLFALLYAAAGGNDGNLPLQNEATYDDPNTGALFALDKVDLFNLLCVPYDSAVAGAEGPAIDAYPTLAEYCQKRRAMFIVDPPYGRSNSWATLARNDEWETFDPTVLHIAGDSGRNAAVYFPRVVEADPLLKGDSRVMPACGIIAGVMASTDASRGVWKAPAGIAAGLSGPGLSLDIKLTDDQNGVLNPLGINCLRSFPVYGPVVWGARTMRGADLLEDDYKYIPVRRLTLYIEESLYRGTKWAVFEPNADPLWTSLRNTVNVFLSGLQRQGAFYSYFVNCDNKTTTMDDILLGVVNIIVGIAPLKPAEFVVIQIQQTAGQSS